MNTTTKNEKEKVKIRLEIADNNESDQKGLLKVAGFYKHDCLWMEGVEVVSSMLDADILVFPGGADVNPALYGEEEGRFTSFYEGTDAAQISFYKLYAGEKKFFGICRGLQLLHVMAGGKLVQDITHPSRHEIYTYDGKVLMTNSLHHQQVMFEGLVEGEDYVLLAWANNLSKQHLNGKNEDYNFPDNYKEPEVVYYPKIKALGIQGHPEMSLPAKTLDWLNDQVKKYLLT